MIALRTAMLVVASAALLSGCSDPMAARDRFLASGDAYRASRRFVEATIEYRNAAERDPQSVDAHRKLAETYVEMNKAAEALVTYEQLSDLDRQSVAARLRAASLLAAAGEFDRAAGRAREAIALDSRNAEGHVLLAEALAGMRRPNEATESLSAAIAANPSALGYAAFGELQLARGDRAGAEESFLTAVRIDPASVRARVSLAEYYWRAKRTADAERQFAAALERAPVDPLVNRAYAFFLMSTGRAAAAEPQWKTIAAHSASGSGQLELSDYYVSTNRRRDALAILEPLVDRDTTGEATTRLAALLDESGEKPRAMDLLDRELKVRPSNRRALMLKARLLLDQHHSNDAAEHARQVIALEPTSWTAHELLGLAQAAQGDMDAAAGSFREVIRLNPSTGPARMELATAYAASGDSDKAIWTLEQAFPQHPESSGVAANNIAWKLVRAVPTNADAALPLAQYATSKLPGRAAPWDTLGSIYLSRGNATDAVAAFEKSTKLAPQNPEYRERLEEARRRSLGVN